MSFPAEKQDMEFQAKLTQGEQEDIRVLCEQ